VVWLHGAILNKPRDVADAQRMLGALRGQTHTVFTGICLRERFKDKADEYFTSHEATRVTFGDVSDSWIEAYVATGEPMDKAGAYAAQGRGAILVQSIEGDFWNVVGLPIYKTARLLEAAGMPVEKFWNSER
jgi:septum formation protein